MDNFTQFDSWAFDRDILAAIDRAELATKPSATKQSSNGRTMEAATSILSAGNFTAEGMSASGRVAPALDEDIEKVVADKDILSAYHRDESGDGELFAAMYRDLIVFDHSGRGWHLWDAEHWQQDKIGAVTNLVSGPLAAKYLLLASRKRGKAERSEAEDKDIEGLILRAAKLRAKYRISNVLDRAATQPGIRMVGEEWDQKPLLLAVANGVIELSNGEYRHGKPGDYLRTASPVEWMGLHAPAERWERFLKEIFGGDTEVISFLQRLLGYGITGLSTEHILPVLWGEGRNGKDTLLETLKFVLGDLASPVGIEVLLDGGRNPNAAAPHLVNLRKYRLCWVSETNEGARLNAGQVKLLTGGGTISARPLYGDPLSFIPQYLLMLVTNHKPHANAEDYALWKRVLLIEFHESFVDHPEQEHEHERDPNLAAKLRAESSGILAWLVRGTLEWQRQGLNPPDSILAATEEYKSQEDRIGEFISEQCVAGDDCEIKARSLYIQYANWEKGGGGKPMSETAFGRRIGKLYQSEHRDSGKWYLGVKLKDTVTEYASIL